MAPEAINPSAVNGDRTDPAMSPLKKTGMKIGRPSDIWSLGCILYQMIYGRPPFAALNTIQKLVAIPNPNYEIAYHPHEDQDALETIKSCLVRHPRERSPITGPEGLLSKPFLQVARHTSCQNPLDPQSAMNSTLPDHAQPNFSGSTQTSMTSSKETSRNSRVISRDAEENVNQNSIKENINHKKVIVTQDLKKKLLPSNLREEIVQSENKLISLQSKEANTKASKWMKDKVVESSDMKSILEKRMVQMR